MMGEFKPINGEIFKQLMGSKITKSVISEDVSLLKLNK